MNVLVKATTVTQPRQFRLPFIVAFVAMMFCQLLFSGLATASELPDHNETKPFTVSVTGQGKAVILIPGLMSDARVWNDLSRVLEKRYQLHLVNIAGFAETPAVPNPSLLKVKQQLLDYIEQNKLDKPAIIGHSLGGFMAMWVASDSPDSVGPIISVDGLPFIGPVFTQTNTSTVESLASQAAQMRDMYSAMTSQQLSMQSRYGLSHQATSIEAQNTVMAMIEPSDPATVGEALFTLLSTDLRQDIGKINTPLLLLGATGGLTEKAQKQAAKQLYKQQLAALPQAKLVMNNQSRHFIMLDDPNWLTKQVVEFLGAAL